jgi:NAD(P)-dependent dehydrogenase (short-subunit alcohol dehydrogenase family)
VAVVKRVCMLTGASGTFGTAFIEQCAADYHIAAIHHCTPISFATQDQVFVDSLAPENLIPANDLAVHAIRGDLSRPDEIARVAAEALAVFGQVDLLINAAVHRSFSALLDPATLEHAGRAWQLNVLAPLLLSIEMANRFFKTDPADNALHNRNVVNLSSTAGLFVYPDFGQAMYATSKAALNHLTYHLASEFWDLGVRVNAVAPDTFPGRVPTEDVVDAVLALDRSQKTGTIDQVVGSSA